MTSKIRLMMALTLWFAHSAVFATGLGWAGGGGELLKNSGNPWFLQNIERVRYCIQRGNGFSLDADTSLELIDKAFAAWKRELAATANTAQRLGVVQVKVGTQDFIYTACDGREDLTIQLGTLTAEQRKFFGVYRKYVGAAIRTSYDEAELRGKGFVFIASDRGSDRYEGDVSDGFWSLDEGMRFYRVVLHEFGHVFGIPHMDLVHSSFIGKGVELMDSDAPEKIVAGEQMVWPFTANEQLLRVISRTPTAVSLCKDSGNEDWKLRRFLGVSLPYKCIQIDTYHDQYIINIHPDILRHPDLPVIGYGRITTKTLPQIQYEPVVTVKITPDQRVFDLSSLGGAFFDVLKFLPGPGFIKKRVSGQFASQDGRVSKPVAVTIDFNHNLELSGILDDELVSNLNTTK
jgi:hypothetical protein